MALTVSGFLRLSDLCHARLNARSTAAMRVGALWSLHLVAALAAARLTVRNSSVVDGYDALINLPDAPKPWPVLVWLHGGTLSDKDRSDRGQAVSGRRDSTISSTAKASRA